MARGRDALAAVRAFDRVSARPPYVFDIPAHAVLGVQRDFAALVRARGLDAELEAVPRVPHRQRVRELLAVTPAGAEVPFHGISCVALAEVPAGPLPVVGERMPPDSDDAGRWRAVWIECLPGSSAIASSIEIGRVAVDRARLSLADADALGAWIHEEPIDGLADVVFWGRDADAIATRTSAPDLGDGTFGWLDLPIADAVPRAQALEALRSEELRFATDFRPHSHHHALMAHVRATPTASGTLRIGGASLCGFATTWGDGFFPVYRDLTADGRLARIRIALGTDDTVSLMRALADRDRGVLVSARVLDDGAPVRWLYREAPDREDDSGWRVFSGDEGDAYLADPANLRIVPLRALLERDAALAPLVVAPAPCAFERADDGRFVPVTFEPPAD